MPAMSLGNSETTSPTANSESGNISNSTMDQIVLNNLRRDMYAIGVPIILAMCVLVMLANGIILLAVRWIKTPIMQHPTLALTLSLAVSDLWTSLCIGFSMVYNSYFYTVWEISVNACVSIALEAVRQGGMITASLHLLALAFVHFRAMAYPNSFNNVVIAKFNRMVIIQAWLVPPVILLIFFCMWPGELFLSPYHSKWRYCWKTNGVTGQLPYRLVIFFIFLAPFVLMFIFYASFCMRLRRQNAQFARKPRPRNESTQGGGQSDAENKQLKNTRRATKTALWVLVTFFVGWLPTSLMFVLMCETCVVSFRADTVGKLTSVIILGVISNFFILGKSLVNPIIYAVRIPEIKTVLRKQYARCKFEWPRKRGNLNSKNRALLKPCAMAVFHEAPIAQSDDCDDHQGTDHHGIDSDRNAGMAGKSNSENDSLLKNNGANFKNGGDKVTGC